MQLSWIIFTNSINRNAGIWICGIVFTLVGTGLSIVGALEEKLLFAISIPFVFLGVLIILAASYSLWLAFDAIENEQVFIWWTHFIGGLAGAFLFSVPSTLVLPVLLIVGADEFWLGFIFTPIGFILTAILIIMAVKQFTKRPRWQKTKN